MSIESRSEEEVKMDAKVRVLRDRAKAIEKAGGENREVNLKRVFVELNVEIRSFSDFYTKWVMEYMANASQAGDTAHDAADALNWMISDETSDSHADRKCNKTPDERYSMYRGELTRVFAKLISFHKEQCYECREKEIELHHDPLTACQVEGQGYYHLDVMRKWLGIKIYLARCDFALHEWCANLYITQSDGFRTACDFKRTLYVTVKSLCAKNSTVKCDVESIMNAVKRDPAYIRANKRAAQAFMQCAESTSEYKWFRRTYAFKASIASARANAGLLPTETDVIEDLRSKVVASAAGLKIEEAYACSAKGLMTDAIHVAWANTAHRDKKACYSGA